MSLYSRHLLPRMVHAACSSKPVTRQRRKVVPHAEGTVLEVGYGSGLNLRHYDPSRVTRLFALEPSVEMAEMGRESAANAPFPVEVLCAPGEAIPLDSGTVDTVLVTYTLCTIADVTSALGQVARVLKPGGRLLFCEHGAAPDPWVRRFQGWLTPAWGCFGGGCRLDRDIPHLLRDGGFTIEEISSGYIDGWRPVSFNYWGSARPA